MDNWVEKFQDIVDWFKGKKTYIVALIAAILVFLQQVVGITIPAFVYVVLGILGITGVKAGQNRIENGKGK